VFVAVLVIVGIPDGGGRCLTGDSC
jgi:hypothetical protein